MKLETKPYCITQIMYATIARNFITEGLSDKIAFMIFLM